MTIAIGRAGLDSGLTLTSPRSWSVEGDQVTIDGDLTATTAAGLVALRDQVNALIDNPDERAVPVVWTGDSTVTGFYEVLGGGVSMPARGLAALRLGYRLTLRQLPGFVSPVIESRLLGGLRTNAHGVAVGTTVPWWATPTDAKMDWYSSGSTVPTLGSRTGDGGSIRLLYRTDGTLLMDATPTWTCAAEDYYDMSAAIEVACGASWRTLVGRETGASPTTGWRLNNKFVRVMPGSDPARLSVQHHDGSQWETAKLYKLRWDISGADDALGAFQTLTILRNSPEEVSVRIGMEQYAAEPESTYLDLSLRRGSRYVSCRLSRKAGTYGSLGYAVYRDTNEAATAHTGGVHATSADAGGNYYVIDTPNAKTDDLTRGGFYSAAAVTSFPFAIGLTIGGDAAPDDTSTSIRNQYFAAVTEAQRLARR